jgi:uncharacterized protein
MEAKYREFQIFAKPAGPRCNLACSYCYYLDKKRLYGEKDNSLMEDDILERYIMQHIEATPDPVIRFSWHGGEPLLAGIDFFRKVLSLQRKYKPVGTEIINGIQTNGILLGEEWCSFLAGENFIVGMSIDGPEGFHDRYRRNRENVGTFNLVMHSYELLRKHLINPEILCVLNAENVKYPFVLYDFYRKIGAEYITFLPLVIRQPELSCGVSSISVSSDEFGVFLSTVFDEWVEKDIGRIKIQIFEEAARTAFNQDHTLCIFKVNCGGVPVVEHNGDFYSCDHYVDEHHFLGNIKDLSLSDFLDSEGQKAFGMAKSITLPGYCNECEFLPMCNGECPKNRFICTPDGEKGLNYLCSGYKYFFNHCRPFVDAISAAWESQIP